MKKKTGTTIKELYKKLTKFGNHPKVKEIIYNHIHSIILSNTYDFNNGINTKLIKAYKQLNQIIRAQTKLIGERPCFIFRKKTKKV